MLDKQTRRYILTACPELAVVNQHGGNLFYEPPTDHIMSGFYIDSGRSYIYFGQFYLPLCDRLAVLSLGFGNRLKGDSEGMEGGATKRDVACGFLRAIQPYRKLVRDIKQTDVFLKYASAHAALENEHLRRGYANVLIVVGKFSEAEIQLNYILSKFANSDVKPLWMADFMDDTALILDKLTKDQKAAQEFLLGLEQENKERFGIT